MTTATTSHPSFDAPQPRRRVAGRRRPSAVAMLLLTAALALWGTSTGTPPVGAAPAAAAAAATGTTFTFKGGGWGHGIGMSQWGAYGMAKQGRTATQILQHYYTGVTVASAEPGADLRVLIAAKQSSITLVAGGHTTFDGVGNVGAGATVTLTRSGSAIRLTGALNATVTGPLSVRYAASTDPLRVAGIGYRHGKLEVRVDPAGGLRAIIAQLPMNEYLWGLHEMPASWPGQALQAQAIAGRTFAMKRRASRTGDFDLYASTTDQAYTGATNEGPWYLQWVAAVESTNKQVITHGGALIDAVYSSSSGGHTENSENVWSSALPYLKGVPDPTDAQPGNSNASWSRSYTGAQLGSWFGLGTVTKVEILGSLGVSGRVDKATIRLTGSGGSRDVTGTTFRSTVNARLGFSSQLMSTKFTVVGSGTPPATPNRPPAGTVHSAFAQGRTVVVGGSASDPDGVPIVRVVSTMGSQRAVREVRPTAGHFMVAWAGAPGTRRVCVSVLDVPTNAEKSLGCRDVVVK